MITVYILFLAFGTVIYKDFQASKSPLKCKVVHTVKPGRNGIYYTVTFKDGTSSSFVKNAKKGKTFCDYDRSGVWEKE